MPNVLFHVSLPASTILAHVLFLITSSSTFPPRQPSRRAWRAKESHSRRGHHGRTPSVRPPTNRQMVAKHRRGQAWSSNNPTPSLSTRKNVALAPKFCIHQCAAARSGAFRKRKKRLWPSLRNRESPCSCSARGGIKEVVACPLCPRGAERGRGQSSVLNVVMCDGNPYAATRMCQESKELLAKSSQTPDEIVSQWLTPCHAGAAATGEGARSKRIKESRVSRVG
ncbi:hypothetical protein QBC39DRAFT_168605 [Podospora conica]|nr:hypothetical protein QBC39DRAFT_168605 [Schizothecium conicum]